jgi:hypothetical protein
MEIQMTAMLVNALDPASRQIFQKRYRCRHAALEYCSRKCVLLLTPVFEPLRKLRH